MPVSKAGWTQDAKNPDINGSKILLLHKCIFQARNFFFDFERQGFYGTTQRDDAYIIYHFPLADLLERVDILDDHVLVEYKAAGKIKVKSANLGLFLSFIIQKLQSIFVLYSISNVSDL